MGASLKDASPVRRIQAHLTQMQTSSMNRYGQVYFFRDTLHAWVFQFCDVVRMYAEVFGEATVDYVAYHTNVCKYLVLCFFYMV